MSTKHNHRRRAGGQETCEFILFLSVFIDHKDGHLEGPHQDTSHMGIAQSLPYGCLPPFGDLVLVVDINYVDLDGGCRGVFREILRDRADGPTRAASGSPEINDYGLILAYLMLEYEITSSR